MSDFLNPHIIRPAIRWTSGDPLPDVEQIGNAAPLLVDATTGALIVTGGGGGGGSTDMSVTNGILTTTAADTAIIKDEAILIDAKLPALSAGRIPVEANNAVGEVFDYTETGAVAANTVLIGPIDCSQYREVSMQNISIGTGMQNLPQISNNGTNWISAQWMASNAASGTGTANTVNLIYNIPLFNARYFRVIANTNQTAGTTTLAVSASQQSTQKVTQQVTVTGTPSVITQGSPAPSTGYATFHSLVSTASTNATSVKSGAGNIGVIYIANNSASLKWFRVFNKGSAPTVGTDTPVWNIPIQANTTLDLSTGYAGVRLTSGIAYAITGGSASAAVTDSTAVDAGDVTVNLTYV